MEITRKRQFSEQRGKKRLSNPEYDLLPNKLNEFVFLNYICNFLHIPENVQDPRFLKMTLNDAETQSELFAIQSILQMIWNIFFEENRA